MTRYGNYFKCRHSGWQQTHTENKAEALRRLQEGETVSQVVRVYNVTGASKAKKSLQMSTVGLCRLV
jgi:hypothetical protein